MSPAGPAATELSDRGADAAATNDATANAGIATPGDDDTSRTIEKESAPGKTSTDGGDEGRDSGDREASGEVNEKDGAVVQSQGAEAAEEEEGEDESKHLHGTKLALLTFGLALATFVVALDNTIIATAIPRITTVFDSLNDVGWYGSSYLLTTTSLQPSFGKIYTYFDVKWVYLSALLIFELGSVICAAATSSTMLIVGRAVAGVGASALFSGGMTIVAYSVPMRKRALYIAALSSMFGIASVVGPILGGAFTDNLTWRWCFWINLPFGGISIAVVFFFFSNPPRRYTHMTFREKVRQIDIAGAFFLICAIVCLLLALQWGGSVYPWSNSKVWGNILGFGLLIIVFVALQFYLGDRATMPPRILKQRTVAACAIFSTFLAMALYAHIYYLPFYFQAVKGATAEQSGIRTIPYLVSITLSSIVVGATITTFGPYNPPMWFGGVVFCIGSGLLYTLHPSSNPGHWIGYQILAGIGAGACVQIPFIAVQVVLSEKDMPIGNAVAIFFNSLGGAISVSIAQNIFSNTLIEEMPKLAPAVDVMKVISAGATGIRAEGVVPEGSLPGVVLAYNKAVTTAFILPVAVSGMAFLASAFMEWKSVKGKKLMPGGA
ncbi:unnamed protein product [Zymoseptoria tritici ST99CH_3D1]|uniref:Major facilitator superfamily transporter n=1 Tax=Zymoseptoria tritici (strain CBS 115943 / IPO323) TaxID=336722 RepID=F9X1J7_ZYMTI|nr:putative major facilitator superfamily transporter [Zymoseptoria tritici IPO323]EGP91874.1 putative major facilitator superfamily transporter [Zymoseptoria tritici IPO323]SMR45450.1 unnamed protein product [Zymoseptoria tritici ST99CH_3D1]